MGRIGITILGNGSAVPKVGRHPTSQLLSYNQEEYYLLDCGEGTQYRLLETGVRANKIDKIFITHLHGDHFFGLIGLISTLHLQQRAKPLTVVGPKGLKAIIETILKHAKQNLSYTLNILEIDTKSEVLVAESPNLQVYTLPLEHSIACCGYLIKERAKENLDKKKLEAWDISLENLRQLKDTGMVVKNGREVLWKDLLKKRTRREKAYAYVTDTQYAPAIVELIKGVNLLYHEATFLQKDARKAQLTLHSTAKEAAMVAKDCSAKRLLIGHISNRYLDEAEHLAEARKIFENTDYAQQNETFYIA